MSQPLGQNKPPYTKPWLSYSDQLDRLIARGLVVADRRRAEAFLAHVNYYRFSGYCLAFEAKRHAFKDGCTFEDVRAAYEFDLGLRDTVTDALEILEVDIRATIAHEFGKSFGAFGHMDPASFFWRFRHSDWLESIRIEAERSKETFVEHFKARYAEFPDLPIWIATETMSFGAVSKMFQGMNRDDQKPIAKRYGIQSSDLVSALHHLVYVRNLCAHHSRLWDREWAIKPALPKGNAWQPPLLPRGDRLFASLLLQYHLLKGCSGVRPEVQAWREQVFEQLDQPPPVVDAHARMGMPTTWRNNPVWQ
jgi:abortive infection bacteriophage resistance protein